MIRVWYCVKLHCGIVLGDEFLTQFPSQQPTEGATAFPKVSHSALGHTTSRTHAQLQNGLAWSLGLIIFGSRETMDTSPR